MALWCKVAFIHVAFHLMLFYLMNPSSSMNVQWYSLILNYNHFFLFGCIKNIHQSIHPPSILCLPNHLYRLDPVFKCELHTRRSCEFQWIQTCLYSTCFDHSHMEVKLYLCKESFYCNSYINLTTYRISSHSQMKQFLLALAYKI